MYVMTLKNVKFDGNNFLLIATRFMCATHRKRFENIWLKKEIEEKDRAEKKRALQTTLSRKRQKYLYCSSLWLNTNNQLNEYENI